MLTNFYIQPRNLGLATSIGSVVYVLTKCYSLSLFLVGSCLNCSTAYGKCVKGFCVCELGWEGRSCELKG